MLMTKRKQSLGTTEKTYSEYLTKKKQNFDQHTIIYLNTLPIIEH